MGLGFTSLLFGGAAWPPPSLGGVALPFSSVAFLLLLRMVLFSPLGRYFFQKKICPVEGGWRKAARLKGGDQAAPPAREERESRTTEREEEGPPLNEEENQHHAKRDREKHPPTSLRGELLPPLLLSGGGAFSISLPSPSSFGGAASLRLLVVF